MSSRIFLALLFFGCAAPAARGTLPVDRVVLHQNGVGTIERRGPHAGGRLELALAAHEVDDALETLAVLSSGDDAAAATVTLPQQRCDEGDADCTVGLRMQLPASDELALTYTVPVPSWRPAYRVVTGPEGTRLQVWALVRNASREDWRGVTLELATAAPFHFETRTSAMRRERGTPAEGFGRAAPTLGIVTGGRSHRAFEGPDDLCPDQPEDHDGFEDDDGCPDLDNDHDRILDVDDQCPSDPETYNGLDDLDGCPDRGMVRLESNQIAILEKVYFAPHDAQILSESGPVLDAIAATLQANPQIGAVQVEGHAHPSERDPWSLSAARAAAVRAALIARGVDGARLSVEPYGATRPLGRDAAHDRRAEFRLEETSAEATSATSRAPVRAVQGGSVEEASGAVVYRAPAPVHLEAGETALVAVLDRAIEGGEIWLYRPDAAAPGTDLHPMRAVELRVPEGLELVRGSVAVYANGRFAGEGLVEDLEREERGFVPFRVDRGGRVTSEVTREREPRRVVSLEGSVVVLEHTEVVRTRYEVEVGEAPPSRIVLVHPDAIGHALRGEQPPGTEPGLDSRGRPAHYVPLPLRGGETTELVLEEVRTVRSRIDLRRDHVAELGPFVERAAGLGDAGRQRFARVVALRAELQELGEALRRQRRRLGDTSARAAELRQNLDALDRGSDEALRRSLRTSLREAIDAGEEVARTIDTLGSRRVVLEAELAALW